MGLLSWWNGGGGLRVWRRCGGKLSRAGGINIITVICLICQRKKQSQGRRSKVSFMEETNEEDKKRIAVEMSVSETQRAVTCDSELCFLQVGQQKMRKENCLLSSRSNTLWQRHKAVFNYFRSVQPSFISSCVITVSSLTPLPQRL